MSADLHHLCGAYALDALDDTERASFEQHLAQCADCRDEVAELTAAAHTLGSLAEATPPPSLRENVLRGIREVRPLPPEVDEPSRVVVPLFRRASTWLAAAAAVVLLAVGGLVWHPWSSTSGTVSAAEQIISAPDARTVTTSAGGADAKLVYSPSLNRSVLTVDGIAPAPDGETYQVWYIGSDKAAHPAGFLTPTERHAETVLAGNPAAAAAVGVTVEPAGGSPQPTTTPVLVLSLT